ncbi:MAG: DNA internalization-related competence protein ComEC/Rec2 [Eubacterium sp.]|nr:DNA internalization-related competence protein ComEC/Rec2 [Eubacterium sp.]
MMKRPLCVVWIGLMLVIWILKAAGAPVFGVPRLAPQDGARLQVRGTVQSRKETEASFQYILKDVQVTHINRSDSDLDSKQDSNQNSNPSDSDERNSRSVYFPYLLMTTEKETVCRIGAYVQGRGSVKRIEAAGNPGQFDARRYYACMKIYYTMRCERPEVLREGGGPAEWTALLRNRLTLNLRKLLPEESAGVLAGMLLGERALLDEETKRDYQTGGIMHILAISGLHISMLGMGLFMLLQYLYLPMPAAAVLSSVFMVVYCSLVGNPASAVRAIVMFAVTMGAWITGKSYDLLSALSLAGILILLGNPGYLFLSGFQLSFAAVAGTAAANAVLRSVRTRLKEAGRAAGEEAEGSRKLLQQAGKYCAHAAGSYLVLTAVTLPLIAYYYYEIPVLGFLANLLILPMTGPVLALGAAGCVASLFSMFLAGVVMFPAHLCLWISGKLLHMLRYVPGSMWICGQPGIPQMILYYALLAAALWVVCRQPGPAASAGRQCRPAAPRNTTTVTGQTGSFAHRTVPTVVLPAAVLLAAALAVLLFRWTPPFSFTALDVGQGDGLVLRSGREHVFLVDGGSTSVDQVGQYRIIPYLKSQGIRRIDGIWISHEDQDHISGVLELLEAVADGSLFMRVDALYLPAWMKNTETGALFEACCERSGTAVRYTARGDSLTAGDLQIRVLYPLKGTKSGGNAGSMVLRVSYRQFDLLLTGDLEGEGEEELLAAEGEEKLPAAESPAAGLPEAKDSRREGNRRAGSDLQEIDCLKVAHHGSRNATTERFLKLARPKVAVISAGKNNRYGHPHAELLERLEQRGTDIFRTDQGGAVRVTADGNKVRVETFL